MMKSAFTQITNKFRQDFGNFLAPTYYHDRCERSVHMRLYSMHKRDFVIISAVFAASFGLCFFIGLAGPPITKIVVRNAMENYPKMNRSRLATGPFTLRSPAISSYNQQMWVVAKFLLEQGDDERFKKPFNIYINLFGVSDTNEDITLYGDHKNRTRELQCFGMTCEELVLLHIGFIDYTYYVMIVQFYGLERIDENYKIKNVMFYFKSYNPAFTHMEIWFRFTFVICAFSAMVWFWYSLKTFSFFDWSIEQKWILVLLTCLIFFNDPLYPLVFLLDNWLPGMMDAIFQLTFLCALLLFWLWIYHGIRQNERTLSKFYLPKFVIVGFLWIGGLTLASWQKYGSMTDPTYNYKLDTSYFMGFKDFFLTVGVAYSLYLLFLIIKAFTELRSMPYFDVRLKFSTVLMSVVLAISIGLTLLRFGSSILQDNFMDELSTSYGSSVVFMSYYSLMNAYVISMAYVYAPPKRACFEMRVKDNPTLSMINDSDEEVIYGSDAENHPLNPTPKRQDKEESD